MGRLKKNEIRACAYCKERGKAWLGSDAKCAFPYQLKFNPENWNCALANDLRDVIEEHGTVNYDDDNKIGTLYLEKDVILIAKWYKDRGATGVIKLIDLNAKRARSIKYAEAEEVTFKYKQIPKVS